MPKSIEYFTTNDNRTYPLWEDIYEAISVIIPIWWSKDRIGRREKGLIFRGQNNANWQLLPSLYRSPCNNNIIKKRQLYTKAFIDELKKNAAKLNLPLLTEIEFLAIAQHYGLYTDLLDFTRNLEVAAYFATLEGTHSKYGVIYGFYLKEYQELRNPFSVLGTSQEEADKLLKTLEYGPLPDLQIVELDQIPRIYAQEGLFNQVNRKSSKALLHECIDRCYFRQKSEIAYKGNSYYKTHLLPTQNYFDSPETHQYFLDDVRKEKPEVFAKSTSFDEKDLFPQNDILSEFAQKWKQKHPDPTLDFLQKYIKKSQFQSKKKKAPVFIIPNSFQANAERYYSSDSRSSPYQSQFLFEGRRIIESLFQYKELDSFEKQKWLLWELLTYYFSSKNYKCTLKFQKDYSSKGNHRIVIVDRWLAKVFQQEIDIIKLKQGFLRIFFGPSSTYPKYKAEVSQIELKELPPRDTKTYNITNPYQKPKTTQILSDIISNLKRIDKEIIGSFLYDFHRITMLVMGRNLEITIGEIKSGHCMQRSPYIHPDHVQGPLLLITFHDRFMGGITHTAICANHWNCSSECDVDVMKYTRWTLLGLG